MLEWIQIEARPSLRDAQSVTRIYAARLGNVAGFAMGGGWYAIALGPYSPADAQTTLQTLRQSGQIPADSYISDGRRYGPQFWPVGAAQTTPAATPAAIPDETPRQSRRSEARLTRKQRMALQTALAWDGYYTAGIDGAFGPGTRHSMAAWQSAKGYEPTGILTTGQRRELLDDYNAVLQGIGLQLVRNEAAGIKMQMPTALVAFSKYEPPFIYYDSKPGSKVRLFLISETGDQATLYGLYDILQTLAILPPEGKRVRKKISFEINGMDASIHSYAYARLQDGAVKGFILVWPVSDEKRRARVLAEMRKSFAPFGAALPDNAGTPNEEQRIDLVSGLEMRKPAWSRSGFYVDGQGDVLTAANGLESCTKITLDRSYDATLAQADTALGVALLRPKTPLAPPAFASFRTTQPRLQSEISVAGYSYQGVLDAPTLTFGTLADIRGLQGEESLNRLQISAQPGDAGGPVFDTRGLVQGMLLPLPDSGTRRLPAGVRFAVSGSALRAFLDQAEIGVSMIGDAPAMPPEDLTTQAGDMTVLVSCWQ